MTKQKAQDKLLTILDKSKFKLPLFQVIMSNFDSTKKIIIRNGKIIDLENTSGQLMFVSKNIEKYESLMVSYRIEGKSIGLFRIERDELLNIQSNLFKELLKVLEENLANAKELIFFNTIENNTNDVHVLIKDKTLHSVSYPAIYSENYSMMRFYINGESYSEDDWKKHIYVRENKIKKIINNKKTK